MDNKNPNVVRAKNGRIMLSSKPSVYSCKNSKFIKEKEARAFYVTWD